MALPFNGEVDHHDGVFLHNANQQNDPDEGNDGQLGVEPLQRQQCPNAGRGQGAQDGDGVNQAFIQNAQHQVNGDQGGKYQHGLAFQRFGKGACRALEGAAHRYRNAQFGHRVFNGSGSF